MVTQLAPETVEAETPPEVPAHSRYNRAAAKGAGASAVVFVAMLLTNNVEFLSDSWTTRFYPAQADSLVHFRWDVPRIVMGIEGFRHGNQWFMYYGPWPAILRIPLLALGHGVANRFTPTSMLLAFGVALVATTRLSWKARTMLRADDAVTHAECWAVGVFMFVVGSGSVFLFLASQAWVYHEAEIWGAALALAAFDAIAGYVMAPSRRLLAFSCLFSTLAILSRASVGLGPIFALGLLGLAALTARTRTYFGLNPERARRGRILAVFVAAAIPLALYAYTNYAKFGTLFVFPTGQQLMSQINPQRRHFLAESGGSYFGLKFAPTSALQYFRPDALGFSSLMPFIQFPHTAHVVGNVTFDTIEPTSSIPSSMPALALLAVIGTFGIFFGKARERLAVMRVPLIAASVAAATALPFGYIAERYLSDFVPPLLIAAVVGLHICLRWSSGRSGRRVIRLAWWGLGALAVLSVVTNVALAIDYHWGSYWLSEPQLAPFISAQYDLHSHFPGGTAPHVVHGTTLPDPPSPRGTMFVVGDCQAVYWSNGEVPSLSWTPWVGIARTRAAGEYHLRISFDRVKTQITEPVVVVGDPGHVQTIGAIVRPDNRVSFAFASEAHDGLPHGPRNKDGFTIGPPRNFVPGHVYDVVVIIDSNSGMVRVTMGGKFAYLWFQTELTPSQLQHYVFPSNRVTFGRNDVGAPTTRALAGSITERSAPRPAICNELRGA